MYRIDLNCDMGEGYGIYTIGEDTEIIKHITSANIACGFHAGDPGTMRRTVRLAAEHGVAIGAHPGLPDLSGFGRRRMEIDPADAYEMTLYQIGALQAIAAGEGVSLSHVKPHGALYNMAAKSRELADAIAEAVYKADGGLMLYGLSGSQLIAAAERLGLRAMHEVFGDRSYEEDGSLTPRGEPDAVLQHSEDVAAQVYRLVTEGKVMTRQGTPLLLQADTVCIHGDTPGAGRHAAALRAALERLGLEISSPRQGMPG
ncbi:5-oxoprolinase subunit PxpA [Paenibacillus sp. CAU 1782]